MQLETLNDFTRMITSVKVDISDFEIDVFHPSKIFFSRNFLNSTPLSHPPKECIMHL